MTALATTIGDSETPSDSGTLVIRMADGKDDGAAEALVGTVR
jgi:hypothetical protein